MIRPNEPSDFSHLTEGRLSERASTCPACGAGRTTGDTCQSCGSDLSNLMRIERRASELFARALSAYGDGRFLSARSLAAESARLLADPPTLRLLASAALRAGDYPGALSAASAVAAQQEA
jgi:hypothetical protein